MEVIQHDLVCQGRGVCFVAGNLVGRVWYRRVQEREGLGDGIADLFLEVGKGDRGFEEPRWGASFETA